MSVLLRRYGKSTLTTYNWLLKKGVPEFEAEVIAERQVKDLGLTYPGGHKCLVYRWYHHKYSNPDLFEKMRDRNNVVDIVDFRVVVPKSY